MGMQYIVG